MLSNFYENECTLYLWNVKSLEAKDKFSEDQFCFYPFMVIVVVRVYLGNVSLSKSNQIWNPVTTGLELFTAYTENFKKGEHILTK